MIHRHRNDGEAELSAGAAERILGETFSVLGSTGNVYTVVIDTLPRCDW